MILEWPDKPMTPREARCAGNRLRFIARYFFQNDECH